MTTRRPQPPSSGRDLIQMIEQRRVARWHAGLDPQGVAPTPPEQSATWIVTQVEPVLMCMPATGGPAVSVESTDGIKGVRVGQRVLVEVKGVGRRVAVSVLDQLPITERDKGETAATINGEPLTIGGDLHLEASDVGAMPADMHITDIAGYVAPAQGLVRHTHTVNFTASGSAPVSFSVSLPGMGTLYPTLDDPPSSFPNDQWSYLYAVKQRLNEFRQLFLQLDSQQLSGSTTVSINISGSTSTGQTGDGSPGGGPVTPPPAGSNTVTIRVADPAWFEPGSPDTFTRAWGDDINTLVYRLWETSSAVAGGTFAASGGGQITINRSIGYVTEYGGAMGFDNYWSDTHAQNLLTLHTFWSSVCGATFPVSGGGGVTISVSPPPWNSPGAPNTYTQPYGAAVRLMLKRLYDAAAAVCGTSFPVN